MSRSHDPHHHLGKGIAYILLCWFFFTCMATLSRFASHETSIPGILCVQNFVSLLLVLPWIFTHGTKFFHAHRFGLILFRSVISTIGFGLLFLGVKFTSLVSAMLLNNAAPIILPFIIWIWLKKSINHKLWPGIIAGFIGIVFILKPGKEILNPGALFALGAAVTICISMISLRLLSKTDRNQTILFYYFLIGFLVCLPLTFYFWQPIAARTWLILISIGVHSFMGQWTFNKAFQYGKPSQLGPFSYMAVVYSGLFEWAIWGTVPDLYSWAGILLICAGGIWTIRHSRQPIVESTGE